MINRSRIAHVLVCHSVNPSKLIHSIPRCDDELWFVYFHGTNLALMDEISGLVGSIGGNFFPYMQNRGLAKSWNEGMHIAMQAHCTSVMLLNDDMFFYDGGYNGFVDVIEALRSQTDNVSFVSLHGLESGQSPYAGQVLNQSFACCAITADAIRRVGYFDENFSPAYFEDVDYARRAGLSGMQPHIDPRVLVEHERSLTSRVDDQIKRKSSEYFQKNKEYFIQKWGGCDGAEHFLKPFNDENKDLKISFGEREAPYGVNLDRAKDQVAK